MTAERPSIKLGGPILVAAAGAAAGSRPLAAALACAASTEDRAALLVDVGSEPPRRPGLLISAAAAELEDRLTALLDSPLAAARGRFCRLTLPVDELGRASAAVAGAGAATVVHVPPGVLEDAVGSELQPAAVVLRADLAVDRSLVALAAARLMSAGIRFRVAKAPLGWLAARRAVAGVLPPGDGLPSRRWLEGLLGG